MTFNIFSGRQDPANQAESEACSLTRFDGSQGNVLH